MSITEKVLIDLSVCGRAQLGCQLGVIEESSQCVCEGVEITRVPQQQPVLAVDDLVLDPADRRSDDRSTLPHRLGDGQPEPFDQALLDDHGGTSLQSVDQVRVLVNVVHGQTHQVHTGL